jgi:hypothetical protein
MTTSLPQYAGPTPDRFNCPEWLATVHDGGIAIAQAQSVPNDGTPDEYAAAAIRAALPRIVDIFDRTWSPTQDAYDAVARARNDRDAFLNSRGLMDEYRTWRADRQQAGTFGEMG